MKLIAKFDMMEQNKIIARIGMHSLYRKNQNQIYLKYLKIITVRKEKQSNFKQLYILD